MSRARMCLQKKFLCFIILIFCQLLHAETDLEKLLLDSKYGHAIASQNGFGFISNNNENKLFFHTLLQYDQDAFFNVRGLTINNGTSSAPIVNQNTIDRFWARRLRPSLNGTFLKYNDFLFVPDFGQGQVRLFDAIIDLHYFEQLSFRIGKQKSLLTGFDRLRNVAANNSVERGYAVVMSPDREYGFVLNGSFGPRRENNNSDYQYQYIRMNDWISYEIGLLTAIFDNSNPGLNPVSPTAFSTETATLANKALEIRLFTNLFLNSSSRLLKNLGVGIAGSTEDENNENNPPSMISIGQNPIFSYQVNVFGNGLRTRIHPQAFWYLGSFGVFGEWAQTHQRLTDGPVYPQSNPQVITVTNHAAEVQFLYNLTQESFSFNQLEPLRNLNPHVKGSYGAFQLMARWTSLVMDKTIFNYFQNVDGQTTYTYSDPRISVQKANTFGIGINWYLNRNIVIMTEYDQTIFVGGCSTGALSAPLTPGCLTAGSYATASTSKVINRPDEKVIMQRFMLTF